MTERKSHLRRFHLLQNTGKLSKKINLSIEIYINRFFFLILCSKNVQVTQSIGVKIKIMKKICYE